MKRSPEQLLNLAWSSRNFNAVYALVLFALLLLPLSRFAPEVRIDRVSGNRDDDVRTEQDAVAHVNVCVVNQSQVEVRVDIVSEMRVTSPVCMERGFHVAVFADFRKNFLQQSHPFRHFRRTGLVEIVEPVKAAQLFFCELFIGAEVDFSALHPFFCIHLQSSFPKFEDSITAFSGKSNGRACIRGKQGYI